MKGILFVGVVLMVVLLTACGGEGNGTQQIADNIQVEAPSGGGVGVIPVEPDPVDEPDPIAEPDPVVEPDPIVEPDPVVEPSVVLTNQIWEGSSMRPGDNLSFSMRMAEGWTIHSVGYIAGVGYHSELHHPSGRCPYGFGVIIAPSSFPLSMLGATDFDEFIDSQLSYAYEVLKGPYSVNIATFNGVSFILRNALDLRLIYNIFLELSDTEIISIGYLMARDEMLGDIGYVDDFLAMIETLEFDFS